MEQRRFGDELDGQRRARNERHDRESAVRQEQRPSVLNKLGWNEGTRAAPRRRGHLGPLASLIVVGTMA